MRQDTRDEYGTNAAFMVSSAVAWQGHVPRIGEEDFMSSARACIAIALLVFGATAPLALRYGRY
jgi:hypothetical protein